MSRYGVRHTRGFTETNLISGGKLEINVIYDAGNNGAQRDRDIAEYIVIDTNGHNRDIIYISIYQSVIFIGSSVHDIYVCCGK
jgi:hypothetical protein